jgi:hypothetical protein
MEVKKQNAQRKEDQIEMEFRAVKRSAILCTSIRSLTHKASFYLQTGNHIIVYLLWQDLSIVCGLFGSAEKVVHWPGDKWAVTASTEVCGQLFHLRTYTGHSQTVFLSTSVHSSEVTCGDHTIRNSARLLGIPRFLNLSPVFPSSAFDILVGRRIWKEHIRKLCVHGRITIKYMLKIVWEDVNWIHVAQDRGQ